MCISDPANKKCKKVHEDFSNIAILTKRVLPGEVQLTFAHASFRNKSLGESVMAFALAGSLDSRSVVLIDINITFTIDDDKTRFLIAEVLLHAATGNLTRSKKQGYGTPRNAILLPSFFTEAAILDVETSAKELLKIFVQSIKKREEEKEENDGEEDDHNSKEEEEAEEEMKKNNEKKRKATAETLATITYD